MSDSILNDPTVFDECARQLLTEVQNGARLYMECPISSRRGYYVHFPSKNGTETSDVNWQIVHALIEQGYLKQVWTPDMRYTLLLPTGKQPEWPHVEILGRI